MSYTIPMESLPLRERPAYRVTDRGAEACNLRELLAAVIGGAHQLAIAYALLERFEDVSGVMQATPQELAEIDHLGHARAAAIKAALEIGRRLVWNQEADRASIRSPADVSLLLMAEMSHLEQEYFKVLYLNTRNRLLGMETISVGCLDRAHIRVADAFRQAIRRNCAGVIFAHNHPSGDPSPSPEDVAVTRNLVEAGELLDVRVLDHVVVGRGRYVSMHERSLGFT